ncbi:MAG: hypothetical protein K2K23_06115, partial [Muribaculaceae bacterium]|nr:hypothetical protein [Muribaculaceae bacterium]
LCGTLERKNKSPFHSRYKFNENSAKSEIFYKISRQTYTALSFMMPSRWLHREECADEVGMQRQLSFACH